MMQTMNNSLLINQIIACFRGTKIKTLGHRKRIISVYTKAATGGVKNFAIFTGKHVRWSIFLLRFLFLSEADQSLLKKKAAEFLQSEERTFEHLYNLHYINRFSLETNHLFHPQIMSTYNSKNFLVLLRNVILKL